MTRLQSNQNEAAEKADAISGNSTIVLGDSSRIFTTDDICKASSLAPLRPTSPLQRTLSSLSQNNNNRLSNVATPPPIQPNRTFESNGTSSDENSSANPSSLPNSPNRQPLHLEMDDEDPIIHPGALEVDLNDAPTPRAAGGGSRSEQQQPKQSVSPADTTTTTLQQEEEWLCMVYIALFSVFGAVLRIYLGRLFGLDCEFSSSTEDDFLTPLSRNICVTASGKTNQTGGALFTDLPANMLGCLLMGIFTPTVREHPIPWLRHDHPLQRHVPFCTALVVGLAGSLTTFASWNTQMIVMLDGTFTELGSQVASALTGYLVGVGCAVSSFLLGRHVHDGLRQRHQVQHSPVMLASNDEELGLRPEADEDVEPKGTWLEQTTTDGSLHQQPEDGSFRSRQLLRALFGIRFGPVLLCGTLLAAFVTGDLLGSNHLFYRRMWMTVLAAPLGSLLRWKLYQWNVSRSDHWQFPVGTLMANLLACIVSAALEGVDIRLVKTGDINTTWVLQLLLALDSGFAGSLSTVSSLIKEMFALSTTTASPARAHAYCFGTIVAAMLMGLAVYSPIVRTAA